MMKRTGIVVLCVFLTACQAEPELPAYYTVPEFSLTNQNGQTVTLGDLTGKIWVADFIFTNCAGTCPMMTGTMRKLQDALPEEVRLVSFTVDPARDTPQVLAEYAKSHDAASERWFFLTGGRDALYDLSIKGFKLAVDVSNGTDVEPITHSTRLVLVDRQGQIRGYYAGTEEQELERLSADVKKLL